MRRDFNATGTETQIKFKWPIANDISDIEQESIKAVVRQYRLNRRGGFEVNSTIRVIFKNLR